jgi:hypothetical protein
MDERLPLHRHTHPHRELARRYAVYGSQQSFRLAVAFSIVFFILSIIVSYFAIGYATQTESNAVTDIVLSNIPVFNVSGLFVYGTLALIVFITLLCIAHPKRIPFVLHSLALFWFIRSFFTILTHVGPFPTHTPFTLSLDLGTFVSRFFFGNDLFFSGHTGAPFLMALVFWEDQNLRYLFLVWSAYFAVVVLLGHVHYSVDVLAAFFITYSIYRLALWLFPKDQAVLLSNH